MVVQKHELPVVSTRLNLDFSYLSETPIKTSSDAIKLLSESIYSLTVEALYTIYLDSSAVPLCVSINGKGTNVGVLVPVSDILRTALLVGADGIIVMHNHPDLASDTRNLVPSKEDIGFTSGLIRAGGLMGIKVWDSIIVGGTRPFEATRKGSSFERVPTYYSMRSGKFRRALNAFSKKHDLYVPKKEEELEWESPDKSFNTIDGSIPDMSNIESDDFTLYTEIGDLKREKAVAAFDEMFPGICRQQKSLGGFEEKGYEQVPGMTPPAYEVR